MYAENTLVYRAYKEGCKEAQKEFITNLLKLDTSIEFISKSCKSIYRRNPNHYQQPRRNLIFNPPYSIN